MSDYFDFTTGRLVSGRTARSSEVNDIFDRIDVGLEKLPDEADLKSGTINYSAAGGTAGALTATLASAPTAYTDGMEVIIKSAYINPGATTINVNSLGIKDIRRFDGSALQEGDIGANQIITMRYNSSTGFFHISGSMGEGTGTMALQNSTSVGITGGSIAGVTLTGGSFATHLADTTTAHGAVSAATASKIVLRDANGRAKMAAPSDSSDIAIKATVDNHNLASSPHSGVLEPAFTKNTAFNKNFGTTSGTVCQGNDSRFLPAYGAVGSYVFALVFGVGYGVAINPEDTYSGWAIRPTGVSTGGTVGETVTSVEQGWSDFSGTWRAQGFCEAGAARYSATLFVRIL
jgi:hypothetical protein